MSEFKASIKQAWPTEKWKETQTKGNLWKETNMVLLSEMLCILLDGIRLCAIEIKILKANLSKRKTSIA